MKSWICILTIFVGISSCSLPNSNYPELEFIEIHQSDALHGVMFDLSGIVFIEDSLYVVADKPWNKFLYGIHLSKGQFQVSHKKAIEINDPQLDLEGIDYCHGLIYLINERPGDIIAMHPDGSIQTLDLKFKGDNPPSNWGNAGWEGIAIDCQNQIMYGLKEREPRGIYAIDMTNWKIRNSFNTPQIESNDFADAKFENGYLYAIERNGCHIAKIDPKTEKVVSKYHYQHIANTEQGKLFEPTPFGMGEALLLTDDEIWVGLDNNGLKASPYAEETFGITGKAPVILRFKRPVDF
ncbi:SdiA-regulated domain-containing protein [Reichenbachiella versicolor]|uniref:SdiA-regulated domain-containing protein n=1 Tax=Reichenbachiella versicolor TaxID=1821036 RepID=UPI0013A564AF|nr:SdiA-regulated domain-containing protein [Reichenbachiella versicolor]